MAADVCAVESVSGSRQKANPYNRPSSVPNAYKGKVHQAYSPMRSSDNMPIPAPANILPEHVLRIPSGTPPVPSDLA
jgi:hypothetical protein